MIEKVPYDQMDSNVVELAKALNAFDGIYTVGSCGGHPNNENYQNPEGSWSVLFQLQPARQYSPSVSAWLALEFLVYAFNNCFNRSGLDVRITTFSAPPYLNHPGNTILFTAEGKGVRADDIAKYLLRLKKECFD